MKTTYTQHDLFGEQAKTVKVASKKKTRIVTYDDGRTLTWSFGGGTQSIALAVLLAMGRLPKPDITVFCDTGHEASVTWEYMNTHVVPLLTSIGITLEIASHDLSEVDLYAHNGDLLLPVFTETGKFPTYCSSEWKKRVFRRFIRSKGVESCITWLGMSKDEPDRIKPSDVQWQEYAWPLAFDIPLTREECSKLVMDYGLPRPPKSRCLFCPHQNNREWAELKYSYPKDFAAAVEYDEMIRQKDTLHAVYLHKNAQPLATVDISQLDAPTDFGDENGGCQSGYCMM